MIAYLSNLMIPMVIFGIVILALSTKIDMFAAFTKGAKDGFKVVYEILPTLIGLMLAVGILRTSGILDVVGDILAKPLSVIGFPSQLVPLSLVKMFSSSAATGLLLDIFKKFGTDTYEGLLASILMSCSETIFYTISVYLLATGNNKEKPFQKTGWILPGGIGLYACRNDSERHYCKNYVGFVRLQNDSGHHYCKNYVDYVILMKII